MGRREERLREDRGRVEKNGGKKRRKRGGVEKKGIVKR